MSSSCQTSSRTHARRPIALAYGVMCHGIFTFAAVAMIAMMGSGMTWGQGSVAPAFAWSINILLLTQFVLGHSFLLSRPGRAVLKHLAPTAVASDMAPTSYAIVASLQILLLFVFWTPSGIVWRQPEGVSLLASAAIYSMSWALLAVPVLHAGIGLQSGYIGWSAVLAGRRPRYPDMPTSGPHRFTRNPIYVSFALATWTAPIWSPDQLLVAVVLTAYCVIGPRFKEPRMLALFGERYGHYSKVVPYWWPRLVAPNNPRTGAVNRLDDLKARIDAP